MKVLNLYAGIGGNRKLWEDVEVTAVEINEKIAAVYRDNFPDDELIIGDAHQYLLDHFNEFDFVWSSPPCVTHSRINKNFGMKRYADMALYQEVIFLDTWFDGKYCVENVIPYYKPLIPAQQNGRHLYWCNFRIRTTDKRNPEKQISLICQKHRKKGVRGQYKHPERGSIPVKLFNNQADSETALMILNCARNIIKNNSTQQTLF